MKKQRLILFLTCVIAILSYSAQGQQFLIGPKGGIQYYKVRFADKDVRESLDSKSQLGYKAGGTIIFPLADDFSFGSELYYSLKGRRYYFEKTTENSARYKFLEMSAYLRKSYPITFSPNIRPGKWFVNIGPNIMYWMSGHGKINDAAGFDYDVVFSAPAGGDFTINYISNENRWLFGLDFGTGFQFETRDAQVFIIELRYTYGHTYLGEENSSHINNILGFHDDLRAQYRVLGASIGYLIDVDLRKRKKGKSTIKKKKRRR